MKNYQEIADTVFKKRDAYVAKQKKKRRQRLYTKTVAYNEPQKTIYVQIHP